MKFVLVSHVLQRARQKTSLCLCSAVAMELVPPRGYRAHEGKISIATQRFHSGSKTERSGLAERTSRRHCPLYAPHTNNKNRRSTLGDPNSWSVNIKSFVRFSASWLGFSCICSSVSTQICENTHIYEHCFFPHIFHRSLYYKLPQISRYVTNWFKTSFNEQKAVQEEKDQELMYIVPLQKQGCACRIKFEMVVMLSIFRGSFCAICFGKVQQKLARHFIIRDQASTQFRQQRCVLLCSVKAHDAGHSGIKREHISRHLGTKRLEGMELRYTVWITGNGNWKCKATKTRSDRAVSAHLDTALRAKETTFRKEEVRLDILHRERTF